MVKLTTDGINRVNLDVTNAEINTDGVLRMNTYSGKKDLFRDQREGKYYIADVTRGAGDGTRTLIPKEDVDKFMKSLIREGVVEEEQLDEWSVWWRGE